MVTLSGLATLCMSVRAQVMNLTLGFPVAGNGRAHMDIQSIGGTSRPFSFWRCFAFVFTFASSFSCVAVRFGCIRPCFACGGIPPCGT